MSDGHYGVVRREFTRQASRFADPRLTLANQEYLRWMAGSLGLQAGWRVLDVAAGTGHLSRAVAPHVRSVVALDATPAMLREGGQQAAEDGIANVFLVQGLAESLPCRSGAFDLVASRFAVHHLAAPRAALQEMARVCRLGGRVAVIDLVSPDDEALASAYNRLERARDPSHTRALTVEELREVMQRCGINVIDTLAREVPVHLARWMEMSDTPTATRRAIIEELTRELNGGGATGLRPFVREGELMFTHTWVIMLGVKD